VHSRAPPNKQLQRTVIRRRGRGARASCHYARAPRFTRQRAAAELRRYAAVRRWVPRLTESLTLNALTAGERSGGI
jgi:hypothetical protein